ncbi:hypothetical protein FACS1894113_4870 [Alphaproteobacteria bacterium]|nr:hypothetical protein FACS1894113_4870 [Alphaproteobacteria bacterium]
MKTQLLLLACLLGVACSVYGASESTRWHAGKEQVAQEAEEKDNEQQGKEQAPTLSVSGYGTFHSGFSSPNITYYNGENQSKWIKDSQKSTAKDSKDTSMPRMNAGLAGINLVANGRTKNDWIYGVTFEIDAMKGATGVDKMYLTFDQNNFGSIEVGNVKGPEAKMLCGGQQLAGGTCGPDGTMGCDIAMPVGVISPIYVVGYSNKATKISYYSPVIGGFQAGLAITPDTKLVGPSPKDRRVGDCSFGNDCGLFCKGDNDKQSPSGRNNIVVALSHTHAFANGFGTKFSVAYLMEDTKAVNTNCYVNDGAKAEFANRSIPLRNARSWFATSTLSFGDFKIAFGALFNGKSRLPKASAYKDNQTHILPGGFIASKHSNAGRCYNFGLQYILNDWTFATVYHNTNRKITKKQKTRSDIVSFYVDRVVCPGFKMFLEIDGVNAKSCDRACSLYNLSRAEKNAIMKQKTILIAIGAKVSF